MATIDLEKQSQETVMTSPGTACLADGSVGIIVQSSMSGQHSVEIPWRSRPRSGPAVEARGTDHGISDEPNACNGRTTIT